MGAWGCFDEFNRLEEGILSAVSQHILSIQRGLQEQKDNISLLGVGETDQGCTIQTKNRLGGPGSSSRREASISVSESGFVSMVQLNPNVGIFITMNPSYAGRSQLPDNLKYLFRAVAMVKPDLKLIAQVMLFSQGIESAEELALKIVLLFKVCDEQLSLQPHYDFGLRALKSVLVNAGDLKRAALHNSPPSVQESCMGFPSSNYMTLVEREVLIRSMDSTVMPKLVEKDIALYSALCASVFPQRGGEEDMSVLAEHRLNYSANESASLQSSVSSPSTNAAASIALAQSTAPSAVFKTEGNNTSRDLPMYVHSVPAQGVDPRRIASVVLGRSNRMEAMRRSIAAVCRSRGLVCGTAWIAKALQVWQTAEIRRGIMLVGPSGTGKTSSWRCLLEAFELVEPASKSNHYVIDPKAIGKESLYGVLDSTTLEWTDGIFTTIIRSVLRDIRGELGNDRRHWVVFDGDVDPDWAENLNSVLDDNSLLTLPSGERLQIPNNVRIIIEVDTLKHTTMATVSRCGMVWFSKDCVSDGMVLRHALGCLLSPSLLTPLLDEERNYSTNKNEDTQIYARGAMCDKYDAEILRGGEESDNSGFDATAAKVEFLAVLKPLFLGKDQAAGDVDVQGKTSNAETTSDALDPSALVPTALKWALSASPASPLPLVSLYTGNADGGPSDDDIVFDANQGWHVMDASRERLIGTMVSLLRRGLALLDERNEILSASTGLNMERSVVRVFAGRWALHAIVSALN